MIKDLKEKKIKITTPPIHSHYNEKNGTSELCGHVVCPFGFLGVELEDFNNLTKE